MAEGFTIATFKHVADGLQEGQFSVGERRRGSRLDDLDPIYRELLDRPITVTLAVIGPDGRPGLTPMCSTTTGRRSSSTPPRIGRSAAGSERVRSSRSSSSTPTTRITG